MSSSLLLQQCPACLVRLTLIVFMMGGRWPYSSCFVSVHVVHPYSSIDTTAVWKKLHFILSVRSDFYMTDRQSIAVHAFGRDIIQKERKKE